MSACGVVVKGDAILCRTELCGGIVQDGSLIRLLFEAAVRIVRR